MKLQQASVTIGPYNAKEITIQNSSGVSVSILTYGGIVSRYMAPDNMGNFENIILTLKDYNSYYKNTSLAGALVGRTSGRIYQGSVNINGEDYYLSKNDGIHHINGGIEGLNTVLFDYEIDIKPDIIYLHLTHTLSEDADGYPGNANIEIVYSLDENNNFSIKYLGEVDNTSLLNLSHHIYFNLSGNNKTDVLSHVLFIPSKYIYENNEQKILTGKLLEVEKTPFDFNKLKEIGKSINSDNSQIKMVKGYDHCFLLDNKEIQPTITLYEPMSKRSLHITTDQKSLCLDTQNFPKEDVFEKGEENSIHRGVNLQFQSPPIGLGQCNIQDSVVLSGQKYEHNVNYFFKII